MQQGELFRPEQFLEAVDAANRWMAAAGGRHAFIGGFAVAFVALPRVTQDIDAVVLLNDERLDAFLALGEQFGFAGPAPRVPAQ